MCSCRTYVPMIACLLIPGFELRAALRSRPRLALQPAALAPLPGTQPVVGPVTAAAEAAGVKPGMRLGEALATCPPLVLVEPAGLGCLYFETRGVERLYGGIEPALKRALAAVGTAWEPRAGVAERRFAALAAASVARPGQILVVSDDRTREFLAPLPLSRLTLDDVRRHELEQL